mmetsp:Transcript_7143/g.20171  ORF Transcript_7143/g.20171 Transcript_7143/m.20171 type:complete len:217 (+) Transcript_7143:442-1092(+)
MPAAIATVTYGKQTAWTVSCSPNDCPLLPVGATQPEKRQHRINNEITSSKVRLVTDEGHEVMPLTKALALAKEQELDLVEVAAGSEAPVVRIMNYGKTQFEQKKKAKDNKKVKALSRRLAVQKEIQLRPQIGDHDIQVKLGHATKFLEKGYKIRFVVNLRFENEREAGLAVLARVLEAMEPLAKILDQSQKKPHPKILDMLMMPRPETIKQMEDAL